VALEYFAQSPEGRGRALLRDQKAERIALVASSSVTIRSSAGARRARHAAKPSWCSIIPGNGRPRPLATMRPRRLARSSKPFE